MKEDNNINPGEINPREELSKIHWQLQGIIKMLVDNRVVIEKAKRVLIDLEAELHIYKPSPLNPGNTYKELYFIIKKEIESVRNSLNYSRNLQYRGLGNILQKAGLPITDEGIEKLLKGEIIPKQDATIQLREAVVLSQALGIKLSVLNKSFRFVRSKEGLLIPANLPKRGAERDVPDWMINMDDCYGTIAAYIWSNGYQRRDQLKEREEKHLKEILNNGILERL